MANTTYGHYVLSVNDVKITNLAGSTQEDLDAAQEMTLALVYRVGKLYGDDVLKSILTRVTEGEGTIGAGSISSGALAIMLGITPSTSGTTPNRITTLTITPNMRLPYFKVYGTGYDDQTGSFQILCHKVKITGNTTFSLKDGADEWVTPGFDFAVVDNGSNVLVDLKLLETSAALPTS
jgi:hypothetical protein